MWSEAVFWDWVLHLRGQMLPPDGQVRIKPGAQLQAQLQAKLELLENWTDDMLCVETAPHTWGSHMRCAEHSAWRSERALISLTHTWRRGLHRESKFHDVETRRGVLVRLFHTVLTLKRHRSGNDPWATLGSYKPTSPISQALSAARFNHLQPSVPGSSSLTRFSAGPSKHQNGLSL